MATSSEADSELTPDKGLKFEDRALLVKFQLQPSSLSIGNGKVRDKLQIQFQKKKFGGGDVDKVFYPLEGYDPHSAIVVFSLDAEIDLGTLAAHKQVKIQLSKDDDTAKYMIVDAYRLPPMIQDLKLVVDPLYLSLIPSGKDDQLKTMLNDVARSSLEHIIQNPRVPMIEDVQAVQGVVLSVAGLNMDEKNDKAVKTAKENGYSEYRGSYDAAKYDADQSSSEEVQYLTNEDKSVRPKTRPGMEAISNHDDQRKTGKNTAEYSDEKLQRHTTNYSRNRVQASRMAASFSEQADKMSNNSDEEDTTQQSDDTDIGASSKNMSSSRPSAGPFTVDTILFKYLEEKRTTEMKNLRTNYGVEVLCKPSNIQQRQGNVYIVCDDKGATSRSQCTDEKMQEAGEEFISLYQYNFQRLTISNSVSCNGIGVPMIANAKNIIEAEAPSVMIEDSIDDEVTFVGNDREVAQAIKLFKKTTGIQTKPRKLKQNPESSDSYQYDSSHISSTGSTNSIPVPPVSKEYEIKTPEGIRLIVRKDDIVAQHVDAIVNAANDTLNHGTGVAGALREAAGYGLQQESDEVRRKYGYSLKVTDCVYTKGYQLHCKFVIHAVGPQYSSRIGTTRQEDIFFEKLKKTFFNSLFLAYSLNARSIALPLISSGNFGAPKDVCAKALVDAIYEYSRSEKTNTIDMMILVNRDDDATCAIQKEIRSRMQSDSEVRNSGVTGDHNSHSNMHDRPYGGRREISTLQNFDTGNFQDAASGGRSTYALTPDMEYGFEEERSTFDRSKQQKRPHDEYDKYSHQGTQRGTAKGMKEHDLKGSEEEDEEKRCPICLEDFISSMKPLKELDKCKHKFCKECWDGVMKHKPVCPICGVVYGTITGNQPDGRMDVSHSRYPSLPGYEGCGTIHINYSFSSGTQKLNHPEPGAYYSGTSRTAYLPDNAEGNRVLALLRRAFDAKLTFTIGTSVTTGLKNTVTWNDIHHKTSTHGGPQRFGYPDPTYLKRVTEELAAKGIK